jgi:predicted small lipoprotein YifL
MRFLALFAASAMLLVSGTGCGQKGPLYLRDSPPPGMRLPKPAPIKPVPYPERPEPDSGFQSEPEKQ